MPPLLRLLLLLALGYLGICGFLYFAQDSLVFFPSRAEAGTLDDLARREGFAPWLDTTGRRIGWQSLTGDPSRAILLCHGNAGCALDRADYATFCRVQGRPRKLYLLEYPGYGSRPGPASEKSLTEAAIDAIDSIPKETNLWLLGESLGTGVASAAAAQRAGRIAALILVTPFESLVAAARSHYPWAPVSLLLRTRFDSSAHLRHYRGPLAIILAGQDHVIPSGSGQRLLQSYTSGPKRLWIIPGAGHNDTADLLSVWPEVTAWLASLPPHSS